MSNPLISIGLPVYNGEKYLRQSIDSLLGQTFSNFEILISDNASTDRTEEISREYVSRDKRVKYYRNENNLRSIGNFNSIFYKASADYFMWACHDDYWDPSYVQACIDIIKNSDFIVLAAGMCDYVDGRTLKRIFVDPGLTTVGLGPRQRFMQYKRELHRSTHIGSMFSGVYRRQSLEKVMPLRKDMATDHILLAKLSLLGEFFTVPEILMVKRSGGISRSFKQLAEANQIRYPFVAQSPYLVRECILQKSIFNSNQLEFSEKLTLSGWSFFNYLVVFMKMRYWAIRDIVTNKE